MKTPTVVCSHAGYAPEVPLQIQNKLVNFYTNVYPTRGRFFPQKSTSVNRETTNISVKKITPKHVHIRLHSVASVETSVLYILHALYCVIRNMPVI